MRAYTEGQILSELNFIERNDDRPWNTSFFEHLFSFNGLRLLKDGLANILGTEPRPIQSIFFTVAVGNGDERGSVVCAAFDRDLAFRVAGLGFLGVALGEELEGRGGPGVEGIEFDLNLLQLLQHDARGGGGRRRNRGEERRRGFLRRFYGLSSLLFLLVRVLLDF